MTNAEKIARKFLKSHDLEHDDKVLELERLILGHTPEAFKGVVVVHELDLLDRGLENLLKGETVPARIMDFRAAIQCVGLITTQVLALLHVIKTTKEHLTTLKGIIDEAKAEARAKEVDETWQRIMGSSDDLKGEDQ